VQMDQKTTRMPKNELMDLLFAAFEQFPYWSRKGLVEYCKQPASYLADVLSEICDFIKKGPYTSKYQLKPEFAGAAGAAGRAAVAAASAASGSSSSGNTSRSAAVVSAELETTYNRAAVGVADGEDPDLQEALDDDDEEFDEEDDDMVEVV